ncbi:MAG: CocE/NonD family hydrolase [Bradyrhizobiaceae bacterium]|nr:CocE/NonD family hydrolase [Bradyrhizobiaceae bacterium]
MDDITRTRVALKFRAPYDTPEARGAKPPQYRRSVENGMIVERDIAVPMRDGAKIYIDLFRPVDAQPAPPLVAWSPYGKHSPNDPRRFPGSDVKMDAISSYTPFEGPDPMYWVPRGYAVIVADKRGNWYSEGRATFLSPDEAEDFYDLIEWAGTQDWSNGKVGLTGVSYLASSQWRVAELNPPHLAAFNPWEGWADTYREVARHGGIPDTHFWPYLWRRWGASVTEIEDLEAATREHPFFDDYWASKASDYARIEVPAFVVASWTDQGLHTRGTLEGFKKISSKQKWLEVHGRKKWAYYYEPESLQRLQAFLDHFLKGKDTEIKDWPRVRYEVRDKYYAGTFKRADNWPLPKTSYTKLFLDAKAKTLNSAPVAEAASTGYDSTTADRAVFDFTFDKPTEIVGHMKLRLHMAAESADDMDIYVGVQKLDAKGNFVGMAYYAMFDDGPMALGWLRASHRELDPQRSTEFQPVLAHKRELKLKPGEIVPLDIEIWPSGTRFEKGEKLRLVVQGSDINQYPKDKAYVYFRHEDSVNKGRHVIHAGGPYDSHLLVPVVPE